MSKWIAEFELEDDDTMPEHMNLNYMGAHIDFHCRPLEQQPCEDCISREAVKELFQEACEMEMYDFLGIDDIPSVTPQPKTEVLDKIRAEIEQLKLHKAQFLTNDNKVCIDSREVLEIIDKYRVESEDKK